MRYFIPCLALIAILVSSSNCSAQNTQSKTKASANEPSAEATKAKELEGKWHIDNMEVSIATPGGKEMKNNYPGGANDYFDISNGILTSHVKDETAKVPYKIYGDNIITEEEGVSDTLHITAMTKTTLVLYKKGKGEDGFGEITIRMRR